MRLPIRIYYEDTDCGGVVYYANYLKYFERGRTEFLRALGVSLPELREQGTLFVVRKAEVEYISPCRYDDLLHLETEVSSVTGATITFRHGVRKDGLDREAVRGTVTLAAVGTDGRPTRLPEGLRAGLKARGL
ncbi:MAG TPA: YbgC/FadM family acyl-CoA thioesterase [Thermodesulfobacteriota bacterium]|nr:YbgC/FadM family acyl-CoA thioesterase [Thermodesulfobacteriota bacterium]